MDPWRSTARTCGNPKQIELSKEKIVNISSQRNWPSDLSNEIISRHDWSFQNSLRLPRALQVLGYMIYLFILSHGVMSHGRNGRLGTPVAAIDIGPWKRREATTGTIHCTYPSLVFWGPTYRKVRDIYMYMYTVYNKYIYIYTLNVQNLCLHMQLVATYSWNLVIYWEFTEYDMTHLFDRI